MNIAPYIYQLTDEYMWWYIHRLTDECTRVTDIFKNFVPARLLLSPRALHSLHFDFDLVFFVSPLTTPLLPTPSSSTERHRVGPGPEAAPRQPAPDSAPPPTGFARRPAPRVDLAGLCLHQPPLTALSQPTSLIA
jgi:hypothetical protein